MGQLGDHKLWIALTWLKKFVFVMSLSYFLLTLWRHTYRCKPGLFTFFVNDQSLSTNFVWTLASATSALRTIKQSSLNANMNSKLGPVYWAQLWSTRRSSLAQARSNFTNHNSYKMSISSYQGTRKDEHRLGPSLRRRPCWRSRRHGSLPHQAPLQARGTMAALNHRGPDFDATIMKCQSSTSRPATLTFEANIHQIITEGLFLLLLLRTF